MTQTQLLIAGAAVFGVAAWVYWRSTQPTPRRPPPIAGYPNIDPVGAAVISGLLPLDDDLPCRCRNPDGTACC